MRYTRQHDKYSCGPTAIVNAMKWAGYKASYGKLKKKMCKEVKCKPRAGTQTAYVGWGLEIAPQFNVLKVIQHPTLRDLDNSLKKGMAVVICYYHKDGAHYSLCIGKTKKYYIMVNDSCKKTVSRRHRKTMRKFLEGSRTYPGGYHFSCAWVLQKWSS